MIGAGAISFHGPRLLQCGDVVRVCGQRGEVVGVELGHPDEERHGPMFVIDLADGTTIKAQTRAVEVLEISPASNPAAYTDEARPCR